MFVRERFGTGDGSARKVRALTATGRNPTAESEAGRSSGGQAGGMDDRFIARSHQCADTDRVPMAAVILAGEQGAGPMVLPRPLLPVGGRAILEIVLRQLRDSGFDEVVITGGRHAPLLRTVLGSGSAHGLSIRYLADGPLGGLTDTFLMMTGDAFTDLDYGHLVASHRQAGTALTIATCEREVQTDYAILHTDGAQAVTAYDEKPRLRHRVDMGVYAVEPAALAFVGPTFDGATLARALLAAGERVGSYAHDGYWLDLGRRDDFEQAQNAA
jgi:NDP-mannose synthase